MPFSVKITYQMRHIIHFRSNDTHCSNNVTNSIRKTNNRTIVEISSLPTLYG